MKKILFLFCSILTFILSCNYTNQRNDMQGKYIGNEEFRTDTILIINDSVYCHFGMNVHSQISFNDTGRWSLTKDDEILFKDFIFYQNEKEFLVNIKGNWFSRIYNKNDTIHLNISDKKKYYKKY